MAENGPVLELRVVLTVADYEAALRLYRDTLGLPVAEAFPGGTVLSAGRATLEILTEAEAARVDGIEAGGLTGGTVRVGMEVRDSAATGAQLAAAGMQKVAEAVKTPWGHVNMRLKTPEGVQVTLFSAPPETPA